MDELLVKYILGETTAAEEEVVLQWINASVENKRYFDHFRLIWVESKQLEQKSTVDENLAWEKFKQKVVVQEQAVPRDNVVEFKPKQKSNFMKAAAGLALVVLGSLSVYYFGFSNREVILASGNQVLIDTLPDGSVITLNKNATLAY